MHFAKAFKMSTTKDKERHLKLGLDTEMPNIVDFVRGDIVHVMIHSFKMISIITMSIF